MKRIVLLLAGLAVLTVSVNAQEAQPSPTPYPRLIPGNASYSGGLRSPFEDATIHTIRFEQGWTVLRGKSASLLPYAAVEGWWDDRRYDWNNKLVLSAGLKFTKTFGHGVIQIGGAYSREERRISGSTASGLGGFGNYWFGWNSLDSAARSGKLFSSFPGSSWGYLGTVSPVERGNLIGTAYLRQGTVLTRVNRVAIVPFGDALYKHDTDRYDWNNGYTLGAGAGLGIPIGSGIIEGGWAYKWEHRVISDTRAQGPTWFINYWHGWAPATSHRKKGV